MRTLIYKRTHKGDPDREGQFGTNGCMGRVRAWGYEAVIGVGGIGAEPKSHGLDGKVNWIGIGAHKTGAIHEDGWPVVTFRHFLLFGSDGSDGPCFKDLAPTLADRMLYGGNVRVLMDDLDTVEQGEVEMILDLAKNAPRSSADGPDPVTTSQGCVLRSPAVESIKGCSSGPAPRPAARTRC